ncbi:MAG: sulfurtransferase TusA family protein [Desulfobulbaceae bacterium]|nr:sulfurtransferase TusA family protein [Desulfobulbaceae bacterium]
MGNKDTESAKSLNLVGTGCPMNLVYVKVELARMQPGQLLEVILDDGAPVKNVARSIENEGHELLGRNQLGDGSWAVMVRKR